MIQVIPLKDIVVASNRQRRTFDETLAQELVHSIQESAHGLLHPLVVRRSLEGPVLVAGERRLRAISDIYALGQIFRFNGAPIPPGMVPVVNLGDLSPIDAEEAELEENIRRVDLSWQERAEATSRLLALRQKQADVAGEHAPTTRQIADEVRPDMTPEASIDVTRKELIVSRFLDDPEVAKAPTLNEAFKVLKKKEERKKNAELAATIGESFTSAAHTLLNVDSSEWMKAAPAASFDVILTDPPYGMGADEFGDSGQGASASAHFYKDDRATWLRIISWFASESFRLAKPDAHLYAFCDFDNFTHFKDALTDAGWKVHRTPLIWSNPDGFRAPWPEQGPQRKYELILYAVKGGLKTTALKGDVLEYRKDSALGHPAQKPVALLSDLLRRSARPGMTVLDPFGGSGPLLAAAHDLKLSATVLEMDPAAYAIAAKRLQALTSQMELSGL